MRHLRPVSGYSLIELVIVILILSIVAATVALGLANQAQQARVVAADNLRKNLSHVQALAMGWGTRLRVTVASDGLSYSVSCLTNLGRAPCNAVGALVTDPATGAAFTINLASGVTLAPASNTLDFDSWGRPTGTSALVSTNVAGTYILNGGGGSSVIMVAPVTGFANGN